MQSQHSNQLLQKKAVESAAIKYKHLQQQNTSSNHPYEIINHGQFKEVHNQLDFNQPDIQLKNGGHTRIVDNSHQVMQNSHTHQQHYGFMDNKNASHSNNLSNQQRQNIFSQGSSSGSSKHTPVTNQNRIQKGVHDSIRDPTKHINNQVQLQHRLNSGSQAKKLDSRANELKISDSQVEIKRLNEVIDEQQRKIEKLQKENQRLRLYEIKYKQLKNEVQVGKLQSQQQNVPSTIIERGGHTNITDVSSKQVPSKAAVNHAAVKPKSNFEAERNLFKQKITQKKEKEENKTGGQHCMDDMIALQLQEEEKQRAEREERKQKRHQEYIRQMMSQNMDENMSEQWDLQRAIEESKLSNPNPDQMTYEEMLALGETLGKVTKGFTQQQIDQIPRSKIQNNHDEMGNPINCPICFDQYQVGDLVKEMNCLHNYHHHCIDKWLLDEKRCPVCNSEIVL
ncbi:zinc finger protein [Stylonychia lemnae]|uniref:Zinc finger protein n=1 Tax=Stylonychia lemnae TaxID=5949 RepID=A0A077ZQC2_STYLE|nr:zinc finger protein [Stylonychia lemnae]|eukprot:CDW71600.1 zinc finger protein [Stylonychia lemnae]